MRKSLGKQWKICRGKGVVEIKSVINFRVFWFFEAILIY